MSALHGVFDSVVVAALGAALVHFLWEGALVAAALAVSQPFLRRASSRARYLWDCVALFALPAVFVATFGRLAMNPPSAGSALGWLSAWMPRRLAPGREAALLPYIVAGWGLGMLALGGYSLAGWAWAQRLRHAAAGAVPEPWRVRLESLRVRLEVRSTVRLGISAAVPGPCALGWWRPLILLPLSAVTAVAPEQIEALLAHELAHIRRHDYLVNLLQRGIEVVFFYHPAVWWISRQVSDEREHCCDDLAIAACGDRARYARALVDLAEWRAQIAVAAGGGSLRRRVTRILASEGEARRRGAGWGSRWLGGAVAALALVGVLAAGLPAATALPELPTPPAPVAAAQKISLIAAAPKPVPRRVAVTAVRRMPRVAPPPGRQVVVAFSLAALQACTPQVVAVPYRTADGSIWFSLQTVSRCVPVVQPVEVWVSTIT